jgi:phosphate:Na+ symporter
MEEATLPVGEILMGLLGGLALFLFGMEQMTDGLKTVAGDGMRKLLQTLTKNRVAGAMTGAIVTAIVQSSSVTTVLVVGFVSAGLMSITQSVGVIMGANVGTTITAQIVAFKVTEYALVMVFLGFVLLFSGKKEVVRKWGEMLMGLGLIFFGMGLMSDGTAPLRDHEPFIQLMRRMDNPLFGILAAGAFTALVQSSSATTGIVIVLATQGFISIEAGIALAFGANLGTCVTALLATLGKPRIAMRAATIHVLFNLIGVAIWLPFIPQLVDMVVAFSPAHPELEGSARLAAETPRQIANAHTIFNVASTALMLPIATLIALAATRLVPERPVVLPPRAKPRYLGREFLETPALAVSPVRKELVRLGRHVTEFTDHVVETAHTGKGFEELGPEQRDIARLYDAIVRYLRELAVVAEGDDMARRVRALGTMANDIQHVSEIFATGVVGLVRTQKELDLPPDEEARERLQELLALVHAAFQQSLGALDSGDLEEARAVVERKRQVNLVAERCLEWLGERVDPDDPKSLPAYRLRAQVVELLRRHYYFAKRIAKELVAEVERSGKEQDEDVRESLAS